MSLARRPCVHDDMDRDRYFTAEQAREYGLIDRVIASHELTRLPAGFGARMGMRSPDRGRDGQGPSPGVRESSGV